MPITTCTGCHSMYEAGSEEQANEPVRLCPRCEGPPIPPIKPFAYWDAASFAQMVVGTELCTGAGEDQDVQYFVSPVPRAFVIGAIGVELVPSNSSFSLSRYPHCKKSVRALGEFFQAIGTALVSEASK